TGLPLWAQGGPGSEAPAMYGLSRFSANTTGRATWHSPITRHIATIRPGAGGAATTNGLPWQVRIVPGTESGAMAMSFRGDDFVDIIGAHADTLRAPGQSDEPIMLAKLWCPPPDELMALIK
ncbi:MAG: hypothetical protein AAB834_04045, partial [Patescibacteria group bacterium]